MPSVERDASRDSDRPMRHQHSASSDCGRAVVPMWDSSDPERAPPPLPMNPSSPVVASRPHTSSAIQSAHIALTEKARDSGYVTNAPTKRLDTSPERSLIKGAAHKRMQSLQTGNVRDLSNLLEGGSTFSSPRSPEKGARRPSTPHTNKDFCLEARAPEKEPEKSPEREISRSATPTPGRETPNRELTLRPSLRRPPQSILGENTPPQSATMLALQNMVNMEVDNPLSNVTNGSTAMVRTPQTFDAISNQILSLTSIATSLQREMAQLSRRSKDNATDLVSLKEATNARDEDIRKSLRDLVINLSESGSRSSSNLYAPGAFYIDSKAHNSPGSRAVKAFSLPRIPSPTSFAASLDRDSMTSSVSVSCNHDGVASIALLEKVLRDMGTKDGQDLLISRLTEVADNLARDGSTTAKKLDDLLELIKANSLQETLARDGGPAGRHLGGSRARNFSFDEAPRLELDFDHPTSGPVTQRVGHLMSTTADKENMAGPGATRAADIINDDVMKLIRTIKDSVAQGGGLTAEVKALVRELRGEVLGMGREIGRKLDREASNKTSAKDAAAEREQIAQVVRDGLEELNIHMDQILREHRRQSASSQASRNTVDYKEIFNAVRTALSEHSQQRDPELQKQDIIEAVKEAWENYKPDIELQQFGLEREELLMCLKEGIQEYAPRDHPRDVEGATRDEVFAAVVEGLKHFSPPRVETEASLSREEILDAVRECLEEFEFPAAPAPEPIETGITRDDMLDAVKEGLHTFDFAAANSTALSRDVDDKITRDDMLDAVKEGLHTFDFTANTMALSRNVNEGISKDDMLDAVKEGLHTFDFPATNITSTQDVAAGITRVDILDAVNEGLHTFDFASNITALSKNPSDGLTRDEMIEAIREGLSTFDLAANSTALSRDIREGLTREDVLDAVREGLHTFEFPAPKNSSGEAGETLTRDDIHGALRECLHTFDFSGTSTALVHDVEPAGLTRNDVFDAVKAGLGDTPQMDEYADRILDQLRDILEALRAEFKAVSDEAKQNVAAHGRDTEQLLDATTDGFEKLRSDIETYVDRAADINGKDELLDRMRGSFDSLRLEVEALASRGADSSLGVVQSELENLRETMSTSLVRGSTSADKDAILDALKEGLDSLRADIERPRDSNESILSGTGEILDALQDGLSGLRGEVEKIGSKPVDMTVNYEILDTLKLGLEGVRADIDRLRESGHGEQAVAEINSGAIITAESLKRNDIENLEVLITQLRIKVEALEAMPPPPPQPVPGSLSREDLNMVEEMLRNVQESIAEISTQDRATDEDGGVTRDDVEAIETLLRNTKAKIDEMEFEPLAKKDHIDAVELLATETRDGVHGLATTLEDVSKRDDLNLLEGLVRDVLGGLEEIKERATKDAEDPEKVSKTDVEAVEAVCLDVKTAIDQMVASDLATLASKTDLTNLGELIKEFKGRIELYEGNTARSFEERQAETVGVGERVSEVQAVLEELRDTLREKLDHGASSLDSLGKVLDTIGETVGQNASITDDVKTLFEAMKTEFEKSHAGVVGSKLETDEKFQQTWDRFDSKFDEKFIDLLTKYDDAQTAAEAQAKLAEERGSESDAAAARTKVVAEELKVLVDTLGPTLTDSAEKMDEASKTVFNRVEDTFSRVEETFTRVDETFTRVEETHADAKAEHQLTREQVFKTLHAIDGVQVTATEYHPKILDSIKDILLLVGEHYEHSKTATATIQEKIAEIPPPPEIAPVLELPPPERYDDSPVHEKLDQLVDHLHVAGKSFAQLDTLDKIHQQVMDTAAEVSAFVQAQTQRIADEHADTEKAVEAAAIDLAKRLAEKEYVEATVVGLRAEEERLQQSVATLKAEQESLARHKMRLSADVSSMETALRIRREELHGMEARAEGLERRILDGVIDHSRALLISRTNQGRDTMSRKRVSSHATSSTGSLRSSATSRAAHPGPSAVSMAMHGHRALVSVPVPKPAGASRRILSLNQISHNVPTGGFKRSHSVKAAGGSGALRKSSWGGSLGPTYGDLNKENLRLNESEEEEEEEEEEGREEEDDDDDVDLSDEDVSDCGTMRRSSRGTTVMTRRTSPGVSESIDAGTEWTGSVDGSESSGEG
ncbi:chromosome segregation ATPase family protein [Diplocarpon rosae]|nr:chromosome segregation ATPase family protein [Diplocarpon rosae]